VNNDDDISSLLDELSSFNLPTVNTQRATQDETPLNPEDLQQYFLNKSKVLVDTTIGAIQDLTPGIVAGSDAKEIEALSKLASSAAQALEAIQKTALIDKKADRDEQLEYIKMEGKKEIAKLAQGPQKITNNNILLASREEIMKKLFGQNGEILKIENK
jgi:hypothetical protein